jgi:preprotein translocase subunit SecA
MDTLWMQHLENMQHLRDGIHWRSIGQRDPLVEYRQESQRLFETLQATLREEVVRAIFHVSRQDVARADEEFETELTRAAEKSVEQGVNEIADVTHEANFQKKDENIVKKKKAEAKKKKKQQRQNRKKHK